MDYFIIPILLVMVSLAYFIILPKRNFLVGYRTPQSVKSIYTWKFANRIASYVLLTIGILGIVAAFIGYKSKWNPANVNLISLGCIIPLIIFIETLLKRKFDENGNPNTFINNKN